MHVVSATEFARNFSRMLDQVEHQGVSISIVRNHKHVAMVVPQPRRQTAIEAFGDLYRPSQGPLKDDWLADMRRVDRTLDGRIGGKRQNPWR